MVVYLNCQTSPYWGQYAPRPNDRSSPQTGLVLAGKNVTGSQRSRPEWMIGRQRAISALTNSFNRLRNKKSKAIGVPLDNA